MHFSNCTVKIIPDLYWDCRSSKENEFKWINRKLSDWLSVIISGLFQSVALSHFSKRRLIYINETVDILRPKVEHLGAGRIDIDPLKDAVEQLEDSVSRNEDDVSTLFGEDG